MYRRLACVLALQGFLWLTTGQLVDNNFPFENTQSSQGGIPWVWRSNAKNDKTLRLVKPDRLTVMLELCPESENPYGDVVAHIENIRYSNDGGKDTVSIRVDGAYIGKFDTVPKYNWGKQWNVFHDTGRVGSEFSMSNERHYWMTLSAQADEYGLELDHINIQTHNQKPSVELICNARFGYN